MSLVLKFLFIFCCCMIFSAVLWEHLVVNNIYACVWSNAYIDFFFPDNWYHGADSGDMMKPGWSKSKLLTLWYLIIGVSFFFSAAFTAYSNKN
ncbi:MULTISPECIES: hypothetical protein [Calothrix]|uniref:Uncharacterized protein n=2 Tax=Calothrix TaxID=1186 RepID=A0ABR8AM17_9CYAN|nr:MULTISPECIES: hypothetical protein [Calothrix]MBD2200333.1 hypothetical protein [Calothrix parietina FACHB-288]MBD2228957.1 hypothetical protein [Calothrix anomala FACHB-343]